MVDNAFQRDIDIVELAAYLAVEMIVPRGGTIVPHMALAKNPLDKSVVRQLVQVAVDRPQADSGHLLPGLRENPFGCGVRIGAPHNFKDRFSLRTVAH